MFEDSVRTAISVARFSSTKMETASGKRIPKTNAYHHHEEGQCSELCATSKYLLLLHVLSWMEVHSLWGFLASTHRVWLVSVRLAYGFHERIYQA